MGKSLFWSVDINAIRVGTSDYAEDGSPSAWKLSDNTIAYPDTGTSFLIVPESVYHKIMPVMIGKADFDMDQSDYYYVYCNGTYNSLYLLLGETWFEIPPSVYLFTIPGYEQYCFIGITHISDSYWLLGDTFLRSYYSVWDSPNNRLSLAPHKTSIAQTFSVAEMALPQTSFNSAEDIIGSVLEVVAITLVGGVTVGTTVYLLYKLLESVGLVAKLFGKKGIQEFYM